MPETSQASRRHTVCDQSSRILDHIRHAGGDWSIGELAAALELDKSAVSARVYELLYETHSLVATPKRKDRISGITVRPVALPTTSNGGSNANV